MGVVDNNECKDPPECMQLDILVSDENMQRPEIQLLKWICNPEEEDQSSSIWEDVLYNMEKGKKKQKRHKKCCKDGMCKKEKAVCELLRFMKVMKENIANVKRYGPGEDGDKCRYMSIEPTFVLAHLSAKLLQFEKQLKRLKCSQNDTCRLAILMKNAKRNILLQFISGPRPNETLAKTVRDIAFIDCLLRNLEKTCHCPTTTVGVENLPTISVETSDKAVNTSRILFHDEEALVISKKEDKATCYDLFCKKKNYALDWRPASYRRLLYTYRNQNNTKATEFGDHNQNLTYYYDVRQINRYTNTDKLFKGDIVYPSEEAVLVDKDIQTDPSFKFNDIYEITAVCLSYSNNQTVTELDEIPKLTNVKNDFFTSDTYHIEKEKGVKNYMTNMDGINIIAETKTDINSDGMTLIYNNDNTTTHPVTGNSPKLDSKLILLKQEIFNQVKKVATQFVRNYVREKDKNVSSARCSRISKTTE